MLQNVDNFIVDDDPKNMLDMFDNFRLSGIILENDPRSSTIIQNRQRINHNFTNNQRK